MNIDELLGIDMNDPKDQLASELVANDEVLLDRLIAVRKRRHLTQAEVGERMGISQGAVARIEGAERDPHLSTLRRYAMAVEALVQHTVKAVEVSDTQPPRTEWDADPVPLRSPLSAGLSAHWARWK